VTLKQALAQARGVLDTAGIPDAALECEVLLRHTLGIDRPRLYLDIDTELGQEPQQTFFALIARRARGEPTAYITSHREFFGLDFYVDPSVLIPRPETELLVETAVDLIRRYSPGPVADIGTGSGAIAVSLAVTLPGVRVFATDASAGALAVARRNAVRHGVADRITFLEGNLLEPLPGPVALIIANMPYVRTSDMVSLSGEPALALDGGPDGTDKIIKLCRQAGDRLAPSGSLLLEIGQDQRQAVVGALRELFPGGRIAVLADLAGVDRVVSLNLDRQHGLT
jgi:release factor glutamine methyltransferase